MKKQNEKSVTEQIIDYLHEMPHNFVEFLAIIVFGGLFVFFFIINLIIAAG